MGVVGAGSHHTSCNVEAFSPRTQSSQMLDHMPVSPALYHLFAAVDVLHFNASYPDALGGDATTPLRASDHDPLEGRFKFQ